MYTQIALEEAPDCLDYTFWNDGVRPADVATQDVQYFPDAKHIILWPGVQAIQLDQTWLQPDPAMSPTDHYLLGNGES